MMHLSRRSVVLSAAAAGAAFGLDKPLEIIPSAWAQAAGASGLNPKNLKFHKFKVGDIEVFQIFDGALERPHSADFIKNASIDDAKKALTAAGLSDAMLPNIYTITVLKIAGKYVMFDAGNGAAGLPKTGLLAENMKAAGFEMKDISTVVVTHFHPDHIFGLMNADNSQVYPDAEIMVGETEYKFWTDPGTIAKLSEGRVGLAKRVQASMPSWKNIKQYGEDKEILPGVRSVPSYGHTPGHTSFLVSSGGQQLMVLADVTNVPVFNLRNPGWHLAFDQDAPLAETNRRKMFDRVVADKLLCAGYHWGMPGAGTVAKDGNGYALVPVA
jgi:glyoxylase-like metal-dependent hydrolase (beta-lactamase superfamily II)